MGVIAKSLTDAEIANLSAWYSAIKVTVEAP
jgi:cytochrome c553